MLDKILDGKALANKLNLALQLEIKNTIDKSTVIQKLVTILVGKDPGFQIYIKIKHRTCEQVGF
jgi:methylenetetrahydrofolate dehydrogenase (NADP+)/methenyltetrahydrofolate cyclohydrolase